jgi:hypothetical protein
MSIYGKRPDDCPEPVERCGQCDTYPCRMGRPALADESKRNEAEWDEAWAVALWGDEGER